MENSRRAFLKSSAKTSASLVVAGFAITGCGNSGVQSKKKSKKSEVLYNGNTPYWREYYANAK